MTEEEFQLLLRSAVGAASLVVGADDEIRPDELAAFFTTFMENYDVGFPDHSITQITESIVSCIEQDRATPGGKEETLQTVSEAKVLGIDERSFVLDLIPTCVDHHP